MARSIDHLALSDAIAVVEEQLAGIKPMTDWSQHHRLTKEVVDAVTAELGTVWCDGPGNAVVVAMVGVRSSSTMGELQALRNWCSTARARLAQATEGAIRQ